MKTTPKKNAVKTWAAFGTERPTTDVAKTRKAPTRSTSDTDDDGLRAKSGDLVAKRIWYCLDKRNGCKGQAPFLGWEQLLDKPECPNCGGAMNWHQYAVRA